MYTTPTDLRGWKQLPSPRRPKPNPIDLLNFVLAFMLSWLIFALAWWLTRRRAGGANWRTRLNEAWWLICFSHGDFEHYDPRSMQGSKRAGKAWKPCVEEVRLTNCRRLVHAAID